VRLKLAARVQNRPWPRSGSAFHRARPAVLHRKSSGRKKSLERRLGLQKRTRCMEPEHFPDSPITRNSHPSSSSRVSYKNTIIYKFPSLARRLSWVCISFFAQAAFDSCLLLLSTELLASKKWPVARSEREYIGCFWRWKNEHKPYACLNLASESPRRAITTKLGYDFKIVPSGTPEIHHATHRAGNRAINAYRKAAPWAEIPGRSRDWRGHIGIRRPNSPWQTQIARSAYEMLEQLQGRLTRW